MLNYECKIENKSPVRRELTISVKPESIKEYLDEQYDSLRKTAKIKGFRAGKVPLTLIKQYYAEDVRSNVFSRVVRESYIRALEENKIVAVGTPEIEPKAGMDLKDGEVLTFTAKVEIFPEIKVGDLSKIKATRQSTEVKEEDIEKSLTNLRDNHAELLPSDAEGPAKMGDYVDLSFKGTVDGQELDVLKGENRLVEIGAKRFMEEFETNLVGLKKGDTKKFDVKFPDDISEPQLAGKTAAFEVTIHEFKKKELPPLDDEFAKRFKLESADDLRKKVGETMKEDREKESREKLKEDVLEALVRSHEFEVPASLIRSQLEYLVKENIEYLRRQGFTEKMTREYLDKNRDELSKRAEDQVRASLILDRVAQDQNIRVESADLDHEYTKTAERLNMTLDQVRGLYQNDENALRQLRFRLKEERTVDYVLGQVKITDAK